MEWILDGAPLVNPRGGNYSAPRDVLQVYIDEFDRAWRKAPCRCSPRTRTTSATAPASSSWKGSSSTSNARGNVWYATHREVAEFVLGG